MSGIAEETASVLGEPIAEGFGKYLSVHAAAREHIGEDKAKDVHDGNAFLLCRADGAETAYDMERAEKD